MLTWCSSEANCSFFTCLCHLPYSFQRIGHANPVLCPARALLIRIPLGHRSWPHPLPTGCPALFGSFFATMAKSCFPRPCIIGYGSSPSYKELLHYAELSEYSR
jgi:hypothetical protein